MQYLKSLFAVSLLVFFSYSADNIKLQGTVKNTEGLPIKGVTVKLLAAGIDATTDSAGRFLIEQIASGTGIIKSIPKIQPYMKNSILSFSVQEPIQQITIDVFDVSGRKVQTVLNEQLKAGVYSIPIPIGKHTRLSQGFYFVRLHVGIVISTFKTTPFSKTLQSTSAAILSKRTAVAYVDTLQFLMGLCHERSVPVESYTVSLGTIVLQAKPSIPATENLGNEQVKILPSSNDGPAPRITITEFPGEVSKSFEHDSILTKPMVLGLAGSISDTNGFMLRLPFNTGMITNANDLNVFAILQKDSVSIQYHGFLTGDTLNIALPSIDSGIVVSLAYNPNLLSVMWDSAGLDQGLKKALQNSKLWPTKNMWCSFDPNDNDLQQAIRSALKISTIPSIDEMRGYIIKLCKMASTAATKYDSTYNFRFPDFQKYDDPPKDHLTAGGGDRYVGKFYQFFIGKYAISHSDAIDPSNYGIYIAYDRFDDPGPNSNLGTVYASISHEMMHNVIGGFDLYRVNPPGRTVVQDLFIASIGFNEGIATVMGHTLDWDDGSIHVRNESIFMLDDTLCEYYRKYSNQDFFAYIGKRYEGNSMKYVGPLLDGVYSQTQNLGTTLSVHEYYRSLMAGLNAYFKDSLWYYYTDFIRNRAYEHNAASILRSGDSTMPYTLNAAIAPVAKIISTSPITVSIGNISSFSSRAITIDFSSLTQSSYRITISANISLNDKNLSAIMYPEDTQGKMKISFSPIVDSTFVLNTRNTKYATILLINNAFQGANNVQIEIKEIPPSVDFTATPATGNAPLQVQFTDTVNSDSGAVTAWQWDFGDGGSSTVRNPSHIYSDSGVYLVRLIASNSSDADTANLTVYVNLTPGQYVVRFDSQGGSAVASQTVSSGATASVPTPPDYPPRPCLSCSFGGWSSSPSGTSVWNFSTPITTNIVLYAFWQCECLCECE